MALRRSRSDRWVAGVCGGIAKELGVASWVVRVLWIVLFGIGLIAYLVLWAVIPEEGSGGPGILA